MKIKLSATNLILIIIVICICGLFLMQYNMQNQMYVCEKQLELYNKQLELYNKQLELCNKQLELYGDILLDINQEINNLYETNKLYKNFIASTLQMSEKESLNSDLYDSYYGRLYIPSVEINVALYNNHEQNTTDRNDSANIFSWGSYSGQNIVDHSNQEFLKLVDVELGTQGYIFLRDGSIVNIECVEIFNGHNIGNDITDEFGISAMGRTDYMMYTCRDNCQNVRICLWDTVEEYNF